MAFCFFNHTWEYLSKPAAPAEMDENIAYAIALAIKEAWGDHLSEKFFAVAGAKW